MTARRSLLLAAALGALATVAGILSRPLMPVDETRYCSVAWEMLRSGTWLVPHLNGEPYSHKPPLLFWLIGGGWKLLGISTAWARLVGPLFGIASLWLTRRLARALWPERESISRLAPLILAGTLLWTVYSTLTMFDALLTAAVLAGLLGLAVAAEGKEAKGWLLMAGGVGFALHAKGPVAFAHVLPAALLAPWWAVRGLPVPRRAWFGRLGLALLGGLAAILAWAIPASLAGGQAFGKAIFLGQTTGRVVHAFAHRRPAWWYLPLLPAMTLPWWCWPRLWRGCSALAALAPETGIRFCLAWTLPALAFFSAVSGKQLHYLLPLMPAFALLAARAIDEPAGGLPAERRTARIATAAVAVAILLQGLASRELHRRYDLAPVAALARRCEQANRPVAHHGNYAGQYHFLGRLTRPFTILHGDEPAGWLRRHPDGVVITDAHPGGCRPVAGSRLMERFPVEGTKTICAWEAEGPPGR